MIRNLVRWLVRLFFFALIVGAVGFVITRLMGGEDEDFDDFEDLEASFEFNETPVEIDVSGPATTSEAQAAMPGEMSSEMPAETDAEMGPAENAEESAPPSSHPSADTIALDDRLLDNEDTSSSMNASTNGSAAGSRLIDIKGIGPNYETRLRAIGINNMNDLLNADSHHIAEQVGVIGGASQVDDWKEQARSMMSGGNA